MASVKIPSASSLVTGVDFREQGLKLRRHFPQPLLGNRGGCEGLYADRLLLPKGAPEQQFYSGSLRGGQMLYPVNHGICCPTYRAAPLWEL